eukprot:TRINITY_DN22_c0_g1_i2.p1 TRINITY_DN22_c0_g1~~TRINITY_DN22_c0_g1_i2.p1  ORF type:complete len:646 (+),score=147.02 TRINITY_DN22_c0_g1_i2:143-1939(+)
MGGAPRQSRRKEAQSSAGSRGGRASKKAAARAADAAAAEAAAAAAAAADAALWHFVWRRVEEAAQAVAAAREPKRRRLEGKQPPPCLAIVPYRIIGKRPPPGRVWAVPPPAPGPRGTTLRGHYDVLGLSRTAEPSEVHAAYRRRARETHPDKGGSALDFHRVVEAFEELADRSRRAAYDRSLEYFGRRDGLGSIPGVAGASSNGTSASAASAEGRRWLQASARTAEATLLGSASAAWPAYLAQLSFGALEVLQTLLRAVSSGGASCTGTPGGDADSAGGREGAEPKASAEAAAPELAASVLPSRGPARILRRGKSFKVVLSWAALSISTKCTTSLGEAVDWQIALLWVRGVAQARMRRLARGAGGSSDSAVDPLTPEELLQALEAEPSMDLTFTVSVSLPGRSGRRAFSAPPVPDLSTALLLRRRLIAAMAARSPREALAAECAEAKRTVERCRKQRRERARQLLAAIARELTARAGVGSGAGAATEQQLSPEPATPRPAKRKAIASDAASQRSTRARRATALAIAGGAGSGGRMAALPAPLPPAPPPTRRALASTPKKLAQDKAAGDQHRRRGPSKKAVLHEFWPQGSASVLAGAGA